MQVTYNTAARYLCTEMQRKFGEPMCASLLAAPIDEVVVQAFFAVLQPAQLDALQVVLADQEADRARLLRQWEERLKRARYDARLAERQYNAVDPDNRLVAAELERRWETRLREVQESEQDYDRFRQTQAPAQIPLALYDQFRHISTALPELWQGDRLTHEQKKELLRSLISQVILRRSLRNTIEVRIVWVSGHYTVVMAQPPIYRFRDATDYDTVVERIHQLWQQGRNDEEIAAQLTAEGFRAAREREFIASAVQRIRLDHNWKRSAARFSMFLGIEGYVSVTALAIRLGTDRAWIGRRIRNGTIPASHVIHHPSYAQAHLVQDDPELIARLRSELTQQQGVNGSI
jgi:hypothetical protein